MVIEYLVEIYKTIEIFINENFSVVYGIVYGLILLIFFIAIALQITQWCSQDSPSNRGLVPLIFIIASIMSLLICIWVSIYISFMYDKDQVLVIRY